MIDLTDVRKVFPARGRAGEVVAVDGVSLPMEAGEFAGVVGPSGSGKSTLVRPVNLLERPTSGSVTVDGQGELGDALPSAADRPVPGRQAAGRKLAVRHTWTPPRRRTVSCTSPWTESSPCPGWGR